MCYMFGRRLEAVDYEARGEGCEGSQQKDLSLLHHRAPSSLGGLVTASLASQWHNQSERATWSTDQQAGSSYGEDELTAPRVLKENSYICQCIDKILHPKCNFY